MQKQHKLSYFAAVAKKKSSKATEQSWFSIIADEAIMCQQILKGERIQLCRVLCVVDATKKLFKIIYTWSENCFNRLYCRTVMITPQEHDIEEQELPITETLDRR